MTFTRELSEIEIEKQTSNGEQVIKKVQTAEKNVT